MKRLMNLSLQASYLNGHKKRHHTFTEKHFQNLHSCCVYLSKCLYRIIHKLLHLYRHRASDYISGHFLEFGSLHDVLLLYSF